MISQETIKKAGERFLIAFASGFVSAFALVAPPNFQNLTDIKVWLGMALFACITGGIMGIQKMISGYYKYDR